MSILQMMVSKPDENDLFNPDKEKDLGLVIFDSDYEPFKSNAWGNFSLNPENKELKKEMNKLMNMINEYDY